MKTEKVPYRPTASRGGGARLWPLLLLVPAGCTQEDASLFGKALFGLMIVSFIVIPWVFLRAWNRGKQSAQRKEES